MTVSGDVNERLNGKIKHNIVITPYSQRALASTSSVSRNIKTYSFR